LKSNVANIEELNNKILDNEIDYVYCCLPYTDNDTLKGIIELSQYKQCNVKLLMDFRSFMTKSVEIEYHDYLPIINVNTSPFADTKVAFVKRTFDVIFSASVLIIGSPIYLIVALITKLSSNGPVFYSQERIGQWGKPFRIYKYRSMYVNSEKGTPMLSQGSNDNRITPWGRLMRKTRLDELPQFYNVMVGDMSIVGPRPERQYFINQIISEEPDYLKLLSVKPGITSIGQVKYGYASNVQEMIDRFKYDIEYLDKGSLKTDLSVIIQTIKVVTLGKGK
jgi:exopolysaccharide biosynthesis polyprenyl glycosylphosphotransferase